MSVVSSYLRDDADRGMVGSSIELEGLEALVEEFFSSFVVSLRQAQPPNEAENVGVQKPNLQCKCQPQIDVFIHAFTSVHASIHAGKADKLRRRQPEMNAFEPAHNLCGNMIACLGGNVSTWLRTRAASFFSASGRSLSDTAMSWASSAALQRSCFTRQIRVRDSTGPVFESAWPSFTPRHVENLASRGMR